MARIIDENGRVFGVVNIIDLMVVLVVAAILIAGFALVTGESPDDETPSPVTLEVRAENVEPYVANAVPSEGAIDSDAIIRLERTAVSPAETVVTDQNGELHLRGHPRLKTVEVHVRVVPSRTNGDLRYDGEPIRIGSEISLDFGNVVIDGTITGIDRSD